MKKLFVLAAIMLSSVVSVQAQQAVGTISITPKVGLNIANITKLSDMREEADSKNRIGLAIGVEGEYQVSNLIGISAGIFYSMQGKKFEMERGGSQIGTFKAEESYQFDYINVPILANVYVTKGLALKLGIQPGFNIAAKVKEEMTAGEYSRSDKEDVKKDINTFDLSIPIGASYEYKNVVLDARYNFGVTKIVKEKEWPVPSAKNSVFQITLGYRFALK